MHQLQALVGAELDADLLLEQTGGLLEVNMAPAILFLHVSCKDPCVPH